MGLMFRWEDRDEEGVRVDRRRGGSAATGQSNREGGGDWGRLYL